MPACATAREEAPASTQTTVNAIIEREAVMPKVLLRRGQLNGASRQSVAQGEAPVIMNDTWRASGLLTHIRRASGGQHNFCDAAGRTDDAYASADCDPRDSA